MQGYQMIRTISGRRMFVRMSRREIVERRLYWAEVVLAPLVTIIVFAFAAGIF